MHYIIDLDYVPEDIVEAISHDLSDTREGYLYIIKDSLVIFNIHSLILKEDQEFIDVEKLKEILLIKHLRS